MQLKHKLPAAIVTAMALTVATSASASFVSSVSPSSGTGTGLNASLTAFDFTDYIGQDPGPEVNEGFVNPGSLNNNFVDLSFDVLQPGNPFNVQVSRAGANSVAAEYWFEVTLTNMTAGVIDRLEIGMQASGDGALFARFDLLDGFNSSGGAFTRFSDSLAAFDGLGLAPNATQTLGFSVDFLADIVGPTFDNNLPVFFRFTTVAASVPEPSTALLVLPYLGAVVAGAVLRRQRRSTSYR